MGAESWQGGGRGNRSRGLLAAPSSAQREPSGEDVATKKKVEARGSSSGLKIKKKKKGSLLEGTLEAADPGVKPSTGKKKLKRKKLKSSADVVGQEASPVKKAKKKKAGREAQ